jgi:hypothetical protein
MWKRRVGSAAGRTLSRPKVVSKGLSSGEGSGNGRIDASKTILQHSQWLTTKGNGWRLTGHGRLG